MFINGKNARRVYLCNDVCIVTRVMNNVCYSYEEHFELKGAKILRLSTSEDGGTFVNIFSIETVRVQLYFSPK